MRHVPDGVLRRLLDEPDAVNVTDHAHLAGCPRCGAAAERVRGDRDLAAMALALDDEGPPVNSSEQARRAALAWARLQARLATAGGEVPLPPWPRRRMLPAARGTVAAALAAGLVVVAGGAVAAARDWLPIFHTESVASVSISPQDLTQLGRLAQLSAYGSVAGTTEPQLVDVADATVAQARAGLAAPQVDALPPGVEGAPRYQVLDRQTVVFTFSAAKAAQTAAAAGATLPPPPPGLDGSKLALQGGPGIVVTWTQAGGVPTLAVARVSAPTLASEGLPLPVVRDYLSSLPGIPRDLAARLGDVTADGSTLPIPVPADSVTTSAASVGEASATVLETTDRTMAGVIWVAKRTVQFVAGPLSRDEVLAVARGLR